MNLAASAHEPDRAPRQRGELLAVAMLVPVATVAALVVVYDPVLADVVPRRWWMVMHAEEWPFRLLPVLVAVPLVVALALRSFPGYVTLLVASLQMNGFRLGPLDPADIMVVVGLAIMSARIIHKPDRSVRLGVTGNTALLLVLVALPHLINQSSVVRFGIGWIGLMRSFLIAFMIINLVETPAQLRRLVKIFVAVAAISAGIGVSQFAASFLAGVNITLIDPPETAFKPTPIGVVMRSSGLCITAQHQSGFLVLALPFALWRASVSWRLTDLLVAVTVGIGIILTWNMGGILVGGAVGAATILFRWRSYSIHILVTVVLALTLMYYFGLIDWIYDHVFNAGVEKGVSQRQTLLKIGLEKLDRDLLIGTGPQGFADFSGNFWGRPVHNTYLQIAIELGLGGALIFVAALAVLSTGLALTLKRVRNDYDHAMLLCMIAALGGFVMLAMTEPMMDHSNTWFFLALVQVSLFVLSKQWPAAAARPGMREPLPQGSRALPETSVTANVTGL